MADEKNEQTTEETPEVKMVTVTDATGEEYEVPAGADGEHPVSPDNPPAKALLGAGTDSEVNEGAVQQAEVTGETVIDLTKVENKDGETADESEVTASQGDDAEQEKADSTKSRQTASGKAAAKKS